MVLLVLFHLPLWKWWGIILIFHEPLRATLSLSTSFYDMYFFVYNNLRQLLLPAERKKVLYVIMITASRD